MSKPPSHSDPLAMLARLRTNLPKSLPVALSAKSSKGIRDDDLYEAYLFVLIVEAASSLGYRIRFYDGSTGSLASQFRLRLGPGRLYTSDPVTYALLEAPNGRELELHTGVRIRGKSKVLHEADVLLMNRSVHPEHRHDPYRKAPVGNPISDEPSSSQAILAVEAKYYANNIRLSLAREFLGLRSDLSSKTSMVLVCTMAGASVRQLIASASNVEYDRGVLPARSGEQSFKAFVSRMLRRIAESAP